MSRFEVEPGVEIFFRDLGEGSPIVLLHGWTMSHQVFDRQVCDLAQEHRLILPDLRGHGDSSKPVGSYEPSCHAADVAALIDHLGLERPALLGWSFGGLTAMQTAITHGDRLGRLVLVNAAGPRYLEGDGFQHGHSEATLQDFLRREREELAPWRRFCMESMPKESYDDGFVDWLWALSMRTPSWAAAPMLEAYARADLRDRLAEIEMPTLILHGTHDVFCAIEAARYVAERVPDCDIVEFSDSGHSPQWEEPRAFSDALRSFLAS